MNRNRSRPAMLGVFATAVAVLLALAWTAAAGAVTPKLCGTFSGPHWSYKGKTGTTYFVAGLRSTSCSLAKSWAPRLVGRHPHGIYNEISGPSGFICAASVLHFGICTQSVGGRPLQGGVAFTWGPKTA